jgi:hypothetical protein
VISIAVSSGTNDSSAWCFTGTIVLGRFDEQSGLSKVRRSSGFTNFPIQLTPFHSMSVELVWTIWHSPVEAEMSLRPGKPGYQNWVSTIVESSMPVTALGSLAVTRTTSLWSSSLPPLRKDLEVSDRVITALGAVILMARRVDIAGVHDVQGGTHSRQ